MPAVLTKAIPPETVLAVRTAYLTDPAATMSNLADEFRLPLYVISNCLKGAEYEDFRRVLHTSMRDAARDILHRSQESSALSWVKAVPIAAQKGDHRPAKDLLTATHAIEPTGAGPSVVVQVGIKADSLELGTVEVLGLPHGTVPVLPEPESS